MDLLIKNAMAPRNGQLAKCSVLIRKDRIKTHTFMQTRSRSNYPILNADGLLLMPGVIDPHVHLREPGLTQKEDLFTGSCAAAAGGVTTVFDMPNTKPPTTFVEALNQKRELAKKMVVNHAFHFGGISENIAEIRKAKNVPSTKIYMDITTGKHIVEDEDDLSRIFRASRRVAVHAEGARVNQAIELARKARRKLYLCHISTAKELSAISAAKLKRQKVFCEVTPHHLFLTHEDDTSGFTKMKPLLKPMDDVEALWRGIETGLVDTIGTDHAPHTKEEKEIDPPPYGIPGLETSLPLMLTAVRDGRISYEKVRELMCANPAKIFRVRGRGKIRRAFFADLTLVDIENEKKVTGSAMHSKCKWTPFEGRKLIGWPEYTIVNGEIVYERGKIHKIPGREVQFI